MSTVTTRQEGGHVTGCCIIHELCAHPGLNSQLYVIGQVRGTVGIYSNVVNIAEIGLICFLTDYKLRQFEDTL